MARSQMDDFKTLSGPQNCGWILFLDDIKEATVIQVHEDGRTTSIEEWNLEHTRRERYAELGSIPFVSAASGIP
jgi:hypothetical protein